MTRDERRTRLVAKLMAMTTQKKMIWTSEDTSNDSAYVAEADGLRFRLSREQPLIPFQSGAHGMAFREEMPPGGWLPSRPGSVTLELIDSKTFALLETITEAEPMPLLKDLYEFIRRSITGVDARIDKFLGREATHAQ